MSRSTWPIGALASALASTLSARLSDVPRRSPPPVVHHLRAASAPIVRACLRSYHRMEVSGREHLPRDGRSFVMVANHASHLDALCLLSALPRAALDHAYPVAAEDYFFASLPRLTAASVFVNAIPFGRGSHVRQSMDRCRRLLRERGNILVIFPEGTRSTDGRLAPFMPGVGRLLAGLDVAAVPCAIVGSNRAMPKGAVVPRPFKLRLVIGPARSFPQVEPRRESTHRISRELHDAVEELLCA